ncbi:hypothetical protein [Chitinophaga caseinilytica]|uniref:hypothetical protein n=1 Tax=Chitinophaga caseinilytica TaxID=2267521 RepID=UPI003C30785F
MIKYYSLLLLLLPISLFAQSTSNTDSLLKAFQERIDSLAKVVNEINHTNAKSYAEPYNTSYRNALLTMELMSTLQITVKDIIADRNEALANTLMSQVGNPTNDQLGFVFTERVITVAEQVISTANIAPEYKNRLKTTISDIVGGIAKSFPAVNIVTSVISTLASFNIPFIEKLTKKLKEGDTLPVKIDAPIRKEMLEQFSTSMMPYVNFYQQLNNQAQEFSGDLRFHKAKYDDYFPAINALVERFRSELSIDVHGNTRPVKDQADELFDMNNTNKNNNFYKVGLQRPEIRKVRDFTAQAVQLARDFKPFYNDYYRILLKNFDDNVTLLQDAKKLPGSDAGKIDNLVAQLRYLRKGDDKNDYGFEGKFKGGLEKVLSRIVQIGASD